MTGISRQSGAAAPWVNLGRQRVVIGETSFNEGGTLPPWLRVARNGQDVELNGGTVAVDPLTATSLGKVRLTNHSSSTSPIGIETAVAFDLTTGIFQTLEFVVHNLTLTRASGGSHVAIDLGIRDPVAVAGARYLTNFPSGSSDEGVWPTVMTLVSGAANDPQAVHDAWGSRVSAGADARVLGDGARSYTFRIDVPDPDYHPVTANTLQPPYVTILKDEGEIYSEERPDMVLGVVRPRLTMQRTGAVDGSRTVSACGIGVYGYTNSDFILP